MKFAIVKTDLIKPLSHIHSVVERKNAITILSNLVIEAAGNEINFIATDMEIDVKEKILANIVYDGKITVPAHTLHGGLSCQKSPSKMNLHWLSVSMFKKFRMLVPKRLTSSTIKIPL